MKTQLPGPSLTSRRFPDVAAAVTGAAVKQVYSSFVSRSPRQLCFHPE